MSPTLARQDIGGEHLMIGFRRSGTPLRCVQPPLDWTRPCASIAMDRELYTSTRGLVQTRSSDKDDKLSIETGAALNSD
jgi:hypothetical protein